MTIVVGYIPNAQGDAALDRALHEARAHGHDVVVLNYTPSEALVHERRLYDDQLAALTERLDASGVEYRVQREAGKRHAAEEILDVAATVKADMIVIGVRRRSATGKLLFGSTAQRILLEADCAVLSVKAPTDT